MNDGTGIFSSAKYPDRDTGIFSGAIRDVSAKSPDCVTTTLSRCLATLKSPDRAKNPDPSVILLPCG